MTLFSLAGLKSYVLSSIARVHLSRIEADNHFLSCKLPLSDDQRLDLVQSDTTDKLLPVTSILRRCGPQCSHLKVSIEIQDVYCIVRLSRPRARHLRLIGCEGGIKLNLEKTVQKRSQRVF